jgi:hypothetical protein
MIMKTEKIQKRGVKKDSPHISKPSNEFDNADLQSSPDDDDFEEDEPLSYSDTDEDEDEGLGDGNMGRTSHDLDEK